MDFKERKKKKKARSREEINFDLQAQINVCYRLQGMSKNEDWQENLRNYGKRLNDMCHLIKPAKDVEMTEG